MKSSHDELDLSVCIVAHNRIDDLDKALNSVVTHTEGLKTEIIVCDNNSADDVEAFITERYPGVILISNTSNLGYAPAMNSALKRARGRYVLTLSDDAAVKAGAVQALIGFMDKHPRAALAGPRTLNPDGQIVSSLHHPSLLVSIWTEIIPVRKWLRRSHLLRKMATMFIPNRSGLTSDYYTTHRVPLVDGGCLIARRECLNHVGFLDSCVPIGPDDYDLCYRVREAGYEVWFVAESEMIHRSSTREDVAAMLPSYLSTASPARCYVYGKYYQGIRARFFNLSSYLLILKWRIRIRRRLGRQSEHYAALRQAAELCLHPERYRSEHKAVWKSWTQRQHLSNPKACSGEKRKAVFIEQAQKPIISMQSTAKHNNEEIQTSP